MTLSYTDEIQEVLEKYTFAEEAKKDILTVWPKFSDLRPVQKKHISTEGRGMDILSLEGTIPVTYKGASYNIPITVWFLESFPAECPRVFVAPNSNMVINQGASYYVGTDGTVTLPYLEEWKYPKSKLFKLLNVLCAQFGKCTPVNSISSTDTEQTATKAIYKSDSLDVTTGNPNHPGYTCTGCKQLTHDKQKQAKDIKTLRKEIQQMKTEMQQLKTEVNQMNTEMQQMKTEMKQMKTEGAVLNSSDCVD